MENGADGHGERHTPGAAADAGDPLHGVELRHLRAFLAVVETGSFTRAAERLWITQPALSRTVAQLERALDTRLLERDHRSVRLLPAGERFRTPAARAVAAAQDAVRAARAGHAVLRIGFGWNGLGGGRATGLVRAVEEAHPDVRVELRRFDDSRTAGLAEGRCHVAFLRTVPEDPADPAHFGHVTVLQEPRIAALPRTHPLAAAPELTLDRLADDPLIVNTVSGTTTPALWPAGGAGRTLVDTSNVDEWLEVIAAGRGIGITPASTAVLHPHPWVVFRPITDAPPVPLLLAWDARNPHPLVRELAALAARLAEQPPTASHG